MRAASVNDRGSNNILLVTKNCLSVSGYKMWNCYISALILWKNVWNKSLGEVKWWILHTSDNSRYTSVFFPYITLYWRTSGSLFLLNVLKQISRLYLRTMTMSFLVAHIWTLALGRQREKVHHEFEVNLCYTRRLNFKTIET